MWSSPDEPCQVKKTGLFQEWTGPFYQELIFSASANGVSAFVNAVDFFLERIIADCADDDILADDESRRAVDLQRIGHMHHFLEARRDLRAFHILGELVHVDAHFLGDAERFGLADRAVHAQKLDMELPE